MKKVIIPVLAAMLPCLAMAQSSAAKDRAEQKKYEAQRQRDTQAAKDQNNKQVDRKIEQNRQENNRRR